MGEGVNDISQFRTVRIDLLEYSNLFNNISIKNTNITQAPGYIIDNNQCIYLKVYYSNKVVALLTLSIKKFLRGFIKIGRISNGPIILENQNFFSKKLLIKSIYIFCRKIGIRLISIAPALEFSENDILDNFFTFKIKRNPWGSIYLDLKNSEEELSKGLKTNWRNKVKKGLKFCTIKHIEDKSEIKKILAEYSNFAENNNFTPVPILKCEKWAENFFKKNKLLNMKIYNAISSDKSKLNLGAIGIANFSNTSFYLFVSSNKLGRKKAANTYLLWNAILDAKINGYEIFDLGGYNSSTTKGIKEFKEGVGGVVYQLLGEYIHIELL